MHWQKSVISDQNQNNQTRPYLGVRVKEPVKELLKRKRGNVSGTVSTSAPVSSTYQTYPSYTPVAVSSSADLSYVDLEATTTALPTHDENILYTGWISQPSSFQPITQWASCPEYISHETVSCPYTADMYVQPMCQGYTVVGPPSVLTYASQPLLTNFTTRNSTLCEATQLEYVEQQTPLTYFPWAQPIPTLPATAHSISYQTTATTIQSPQFVPIPIPVSDPVPEELSDSRQALSMSIDKILEDDESDSYVLHHTLSLDDL
ncbi:POU domain class 2-associating factor 1 [Hyperolius riggenbachi]|uniref:POU domain class 2-associating factor 1 n=1 Tax=Hyperolius riggenbachi TaxID=752182 RepID=UPI0035A3C95C